MYIDLLYVIFNALRNKYGKVNPNRFTCDTMKKEKGNVLHINPLSLSDMKTITYDNLGKIYSSNENYQKDLDDVLNLNDPTGYLISNRQAALKSLISRLRELKPGQDAMPLLRKLEKYCFKLNENGEYPEYAGILQWYVKKQIRHHGGMALF